MALSAESARVELALSEDPLSPAEPAPWIGPLLALGARASRYASRLDGRQLVITISVPRRDFAAVLIGCGWVLASPAPELAEPLEVLGSLEPGTPVRIITAREVITDTFMRLDESSQPARLHLRQSHWVVSGIKALSVLSALDAPVRMPIPRLGSVGTVAHMGDSWLARLAASATDLAVVGTQKWLWEDLETLVSREGAAEPLADVRARRPTHAPGPDPRSTLGELMLPREAKSATWFSRILPSARFADQLPLAAEVRAVILDGSGAIKYVAEVEAPIVICVLDRSVADETAAEIVVQLRNTRGEPVSIRDDLGWRPPAGVESLAFTVAL